MPSPKIKIRKKPTNKRCQDGYPCKTTCISRLKNCRKPLKGQAATLNLWLKHQEEMLEITNRKRARVGLSPATITKYGYITAERNFTSKKKAKPASPKIESKTAIAKPSIDPETYAQQNSKYFKAYEKIKQGLIKSGDWNKSVYDEQKGRMTYPGSSLAQTITERFHNGDRLLTESDVTNRKKFNGTGLTLSFARQVGKIADDYHPLLKKMIGENAKQESPISGLALAEKFKGMKGNGGVALAIASGRTDKLYEMVAGGFASAQDARKVYEYAKKQGGIVDPEMMEQYLLKAEKAIASPVESKAAIAAPTKPVKQKSGVTIKTEYGETLTGDAYILPEYQSINLVVTTFKPDRPKTAKPRYRVWEQESGLFVDGTEKTGESLFAALERVKNKIGKAGGEKAFQNRIKESSLPNSAIASPSTTTKSPSTVKSKKEPSQIEKSLIKLFQEKATTMSLEAFNAEVVNGLIMRNKGGYKMLTDALGLPETIDITSLQNHLKSLPKPEKAPTPNDRADRALEPLKELAKLRIDPETKPVAEVQSRSKNNGNGSESAIAPKDEYDFDSLGKAHRHFITNTTFVGQNYREQYNNFMSELESRLRDLTPPDRQSEIPKALESAKQKYFQSLNSIKSTAEGAYSVMMAGGSKFNGKQATRRGSAYDRAIANFATSKQSIESTALKATGAQETLDRQEAERQRKSAETQKKVNEKLKDVKAVHSRFRKTPIINDPTYGNPKEISKTEWAAIPSDYKAVMIDPKTGIRYRAHMAGPVYIKDQKDVPVKKAQEEIDKLFDDLRNEGWKNPQNLIPTAYD